MDLVEIARVWESLGKPSTTSDSLLANTLAKILNSTFSRFTGWKLFIKSILLAFFLRQINIPRLTGLRIFSFPARSDRGLPKGQQAALSYKYKIQSANHPNREIFPWHNHSIVFIPQLLLLAFHSATPFLPKVVVDHQDRY